MKLSRRLQEVKRLPLCPHLLSFARAHTSGLMFKVSDRQILEAQLPSPPLFPRWCGAPTAWEGKPAAGFLGHCHAQGELETHIS